jgi:uncharacterized protein YbaP (TraB family)
MSSTLKQLIQDLEKIKETQATAVISATTTPTFTANSASVSATALPQFTNIAAKPETDNKKSAEESWLFKISKENKEFYLLGTYHDEPLSKFPQCVKDIVKKVNTFITESFERKKAIETLSEIMSKLNGFEKPGENSYQKFDESFRTKFENDLKNFDAKLITLLPKLKPWVIYVMFLYLKGVQVQKSGIDDELHTDFLGREKLGKAKVWGLETRLDVIVAYKNHTLSLEECQKKIKEDDESSLIDKERMRKEVYLSGNIPKMLQLDLNYLSSEDPVNVRNIKWVKKLEEELLQQAKAPILVAVGVSHLYSGDNGLLSMFSKKGYTIERYDTLGQLKAFNWQAEFVQVGQAQAMSAAATNKPKSV